MSCGVENTQEKESTQQKSADDYANEILQPPADYSPISAIEGEVENLPFIDAERHSFNLVFESLPIDSIAYKEMRYWLYKVWIDNKESDALYVKCFDNTRGETSSAFANGTFAPEGEWGKADPSIWISKFKLELNYFGDFE